MKRAFPDTICLPHLNFGRFQSVVKDIFVDRPFVTSETHKRLGALYVIFNFLNKILKLPETLVIPSSVKG